MVLRGVVVGVVPPEPLQFSGLSLARLSVVDADTLVVPTVVRVLATHVVGQVSSPCLSVKVKVDMAFLSTDMVCDALRYAHVSYLV